MMQLSLLIAQAAAGGIPQWVIPLAAAILGGGGIAGIITVMNERRRVRIDGERSRAETQAIDQEATFVPGEKLIGLAERAANIVSTKYEAVMNRQEEIIKGQQIEISKQNKEISELRIQVEKLRNELKVARRWQEELIWYQERVYQLEATMRNSSVEVPEPIFNKPQWSDFEFDINSMEVEEG